MKGKLLFLTILSTINVYLDAQITNTAFIDSVGGEKVGKLSISGWMDAYYANSSYQNWNQTATPQSFPIWYHRLYTIWLTSTWPTLISDMPRIDLKSEWSLHLGVIWIKTTWGKTV